MTLDCDTCDRTVPGEEVVCRETMGDLDPATWQTLRGPGCGNRPETVPVADE